VFEYGNSVFVTELALKTSFDDVLESSSKLLGRDYAMVVDEMLRDIALSGTNVVYGGQRASRADLISTDILSLAAVKDGVEVLASNNVPKINNDFYVCFCHPHQARGLRDDSRWQNIQQYAFSGAMVSPPIIGEIGRIEDVRFVETTQMPTITGSAFDIYQAVLMGDDFFCFAEGQPVELREQYNTSFGRKHGLAWYSIMGGDILNDEHGVRIETA
jgi:N4-gp56 family major capsid protein